MELIEPKIMLMTDGPRYVCSRCGVKYKKGLLSKTPPPPATNLSPFLLQCRRFDLISANADAVLSARYARKSSHRNETSRSTWKSTNGMGCGSTPPCPSSRKKFTFKHARNAFSLNKHRLPPRSTLTLKIFVVITDDWRLLQPRVSSHFHNFSPNLAL